jgi:hypothetical protein
VISTTSRPTHRVFHAKVGKVVSVKRNRTWSKVGGWL